MRKNQKKITPLLLCIVLAFNFLASQLQAQNDTLSRKGIAYAKGSDEVLFTEYTRYVEKEKDIIWSRTQYFVADTLYATKSYQKNKGRKFYRLQYRNSNFEEIVQSNEQYTIKVNHQGQEKNNNLNSNTPLYFDEDLTNLLLKMQVQEIKESELSILVPERSTHFNFVVEFLEKDNEQYVYDFYPSNYLIRAFFPDFKFYLNQKGLFRISGLSQIGTMLGQPEIVIEFSYENI